MSKIKQLGSLFAGKALGIACSFLLTPLAARTLSKEEFGIWALIQIILNFASIFSDSGLPTFVVRERDYEGRTRGTVYSLSILLGLSVALFICVFALPLSWLLGIPGWAMLLIPCAGVLALNSPASICLAELRRNLRIQRLVTITTSITILSYAANAILLTMGLGLWSYVCTNLAAAFITLVVSMLFVPKIKLAWSRETVATVYSFTAGILGFNAINFWARRLDQVLIGRFLGEASLGSYSIAYKLMMLPITQVASVFQNITLPHLSALRDDYPAARRLLLDFVAVIGLLGIPPLTCLWVLREEAIDWYLGSGWGGVADLLEWLLPIGMLQVLINPLGVCYQVSGKTRDFFTMGTVNTFVVMASFAIGVFWDLQGVALAYGIANLLMLYPNVSTALKSLGGSFREWLIHLIPLLAIPTFTFFISPYLKSSLNSTSYIMAVVAVVVISTSITILAFFRKSISHFRS